jgi:thiamine pyrophosphate-dependent acetolactate synthase large subunit-like protein
MSLLERRWGGRASPRAARVPGGAVRPTLSLLASLGTSSVAKGLGTHAERVDQPRDIAPALRRALTSTRAGTAALVEFITREEGEMAIAISGSD